MRVLKHTAMVVACSLLALFLITNTPRWLDRAAVYKICSSSSSSTCHIDIFVARRKED